MTMRTRTGAILVGLTLTAAMPLAAQNASAPAAKVQPAPSGPAPRALDGKPLLSGVWEIPYVPDMSRQVGGALPYTAWGEQSWKSYDPAKFDYTAHCLPMGWTRQMNTPMPIEIMQEPNRIAILFEAWQTFKVIPTDGREHPKDPDPTWMGNSVGRWEGDTLVVDTIGFNDRTRLDTIGHPHSDQLHVVEKFSRTDAAHLAYEVTVEDPKAYTKPFQNKRTFTLKPAWELMEYSCEENNKDVGEGHVK
ncbi:MAG: hypothetical protein JO323_22590 [Acidobacteriia bacterium]|nr:hypothetical protein [Terriglobia bacterium]